MKIAILTQYYPPETGAPQNRLSDLARRLVALGHRVEVLTALPSYPGDVVHPEYLGRENTAETIDGVRVARVGIFVSARRTFWRRMTNYLSFAWNAWRNGTRLLSHADVLLMESPPLFLALAGVPLARKLGAALVTNVSDLWPRSAVELGMIRKGPALWASSALEKWMYGSSALVTGQTEGIVEDIRRRFPGKKVLLFPNGADLEAFRGPLDREGVRREFGWEDGLFVIGYTGILGHAQALGQVLDAARLMGPVAGVHFALFGDGPCREGLARRIQTEDLRTVRLYSRQPGRRMPHIQAGLDAGVVPLAKSSVFEGARPSKMFEIMAAARPLLLCARGEAVKIMESAPGGPAGVAASPEEPAELAECVRRLAADPRLAREMGARGSALVRERFDRERIALDLEAALASVATGCRRWAAGIPTSPQE